jgi:hypothetical protein
VLISIRTPEREWATYEEADGLEGLLVAVGLRHHYLLLPLALVLLLARERDAPVLRKQRQVLQVVLL